MTNKEQHEWDAWRKTVKSPETLFVGWRTENFSEFALCRATDEFPPVSYKPMIDFWYFRGATWEEARRAWANRNNGGVVEEKSVFDQLADFADTLRIGTEKRVYRQTAFLWAPMEGHPSGLEVKVDDADLASTILKHGSPWGTRVDEDGKPVWSRDDDEADLAASNCVADALKKIAETGEHKGAFGGPEVEAAAQAIVSLYKRATAKN